MCGHHILKTPLKCGLQCSSPTDLALRKCSLQPKNISLTTAGAQERGLRLGTQRAPRAGDQDHAAAWLPATAHLVRTDDEDNVLHVPVGAQLLLHLSQPRVQRIERLLLSDVVDQDDPLRVLVKLVPHLQGQRQSAGTSDSQAESTRPGRFG